MLSISISKDLNLAPFLLRDSRGTRAGEGGGVSTEGKSDDAAGGTKRSRASVVDGTQRLDKRPRLEGRGKGEMLSPEQQERNNIERALALSMQDVRAPGGRTIKSQDR